MQLYAGINPLKERIRFLFDKKGQIPNFLSYLHLVPLAHKLCTIWRARGPIAYHTTIQLAHNSIPIQLVQGPVKTTKELQDFYNELACQTGGVISSTVLTSKSILSIQLLGSIGRLVDGMGQRGMVNSSNQTRAFFTQDLTNAYREILKLIQTDGDQFVEKTCLNSIVEDLLAEIDRGLHSWQKG